MTTDLLQVWWMSSFLHNGYTLPYINPPELHMLLILPSSKRVNLKEQGQKTPHSSEMTESKLEIKSHKVS